MNETALSSAPGVPASVHDSAEPLRVGYLLKMFPRLSETFILNELLELERQATEVSVFSLMYPTDGRFHGRLSELRLQYRKDPSADWTTKTLSHFSDTSLRERSFSSVTPRIRGILATFIP